MIEVLLTTLETEMLTTAVDQDLAEQTVDQDLAEQIAQIVVSAEQIAQIVVSAEHIAQIAGKVHEAVPHRTSLENIGNIVPSKVALFPKKRKSQK